MPHSCKKKAALTRVRKKWAITLETAAEMKMNAVAANCAIRGYQRSDGGCIESHLREGLIDAVLLLIKKKFH